MGEARLTCPTGLKAPWSSGQYLFLLSPHSRAHAMLDAADIQENLPQNYISFISESDFFFLQLRREKVGN